VASEFRSARHAQPSASESGIDRFNTLDATELREAVRACLDIDRWVDEIVVGRPYADRESAVTAAELAATPFTRKEVQGALVHHPRIGERASGEAALTAEAAMSRAEQGALDPTEAGVVDRLRERNAAYEERFGHVFLIKAAGRSASEILDQLELRIARSPEQEWATTADELRKIAVLRLQGVLDS